MPKYKQQPPEFYETLAKTPMATKFGNMELPSEFLDYVTKGLENRKGKANGWMHRALTSHLRSWFPGLGEHAGGVVRAWAKGANSIWVVMEEP